MISEWLSKPIGEAYSEYKKKAPYTFTEEMEIKPPNVDSGIHFRVDGSLIIWAGKAAIVLDASTGIVYLTGKSLVTEFDSANSVVSESRGFAVNGAPLNSDWYSNGGTPAVSPVTPVNPDSLNTQVICGVPQQGQYLVSLNSLLQSKVLFNKPAPPDVNSNLRSIVSGIGKLNG